jgi:hypothetical protein
MSWVAPMFEKLFTFPSAVRAHRAAPLAQEREEFLLHLHQRGVCEDSLRNFAALPRHRRCTGRPTRAAVCWKLMRATLRAERKMTAKKRSDDFADAQTGAF